MACSFLFSQTIMNDMGVHFPFYPTFVKADFEDMDVDNSILLYASNFEDRSHMVESFHLGSMPRLIVREHIPGDSIVVQTAGGVIRTSLDDVHGIDLVIDICVGKILYVDITALPHDVWAPLVKQALNRKVELRILYCEPDSYSSSADTPFVYNLSSKIEGIKPLPGFFFLREMGEDFLYVPILGFERTRFGYATGKADPQPGMTYPVIGLPGFRIEYPFVAVAANGPVLNQDAQSLMNIIYADAACPFQLYYQLLGLADRYSRKPMKVALLGTKPHALGAVLFCLLNSDIMVELIYDYPVHARGRTKGISRVFQYNVTDFISYK